MMRLLLALLAANACLSAQQKPPAAPVRAVTEDYFGTRVTDRYRWMEAKDAEFQTWLKAQNDYTRATLDRIKARAQLQSRLQQLADASTVVAAPQRAGGRYFYFKTLPTDNNRKLYVREARAERLLVDPENVSGGGTHYSIDYFTPSPDGKLVAYGMSSGGSENAVLHVLDVTTGTEVGEGIDRAQFGAIAWLPGNQMFVYNRLQKLQTGAPPSARYLNSRMFLHRLGTKPEQDIAVFGRGLADGVDVAESDFPFVAVLPDSEWIAGVVAHGVQNEETIYTAPRSALTSNAGRVRWRKLVDVADDVTSIGLHGNDVYLLSHHESSRFKVMHTTFPNPSLANASVAVPAGEAVIQTIVAAKDALYLQLLDGGIGRMERLAYAAGAKAERIALPFDGAVSQLAADPLDNGAVFRLTAWTKPPVIEAYDPGTRRVANTELAPPSPVDFSRIESREVAAKAKDGSMIPLSIVFQRGMRMDGSHPTLLMGYGAYGITMDPNFSPTLLAWLEHGGVYAVAHVRGGGEFGEDWHKAGQKLTKQNTIGDFLACADYLIEQGYTSKTKLAGHGGSAGGITIGGAITQRPDGFGAALVNVGDTDSLRSEFMPSGPANIPEFGSVKTPEGFRALYEMDAYQHVKDGVNYPAVLLTTGANDPRVEPWQAAKMTARLQTATSSGKPVLLRVDYDAGHGIGSTKAQRVAELADSYAFLFWRLGVAEFQPTP